MDPEILRELGEAAQRESDRLLGSLLPPERCSNDRQRLEQIKMIGDAEGSLPLDHRYEPYLEQLFFTTTTPTYAEIEHAWTKFLETLGVDLYALTNLGIAWWYQDRDRSFQSAAVYSHFFRQLEQEEDLDFVLDEVRPALVEAARGYAGLKAMLALEQVDGRESEEDLKRRHPVILRLSSETRRSLIKANTVLLPPFPQGWPELVPFYFQRAIESELNVKIYPTIRPRIQKQDCEKCKQLRVERWDSLSMNQFYHWFDQHSGIFRGKFAEPLLVLGHLKEHGGHARHGKQEPFTERGLRSLLNDLDGDNKIFKVFDWMHSPGTKKLLGWIIGGGDAADKNHC